MYHCCREPFTIFDIATSFCKVGGLPMDDTTINVSFQVDNAGALILDTNFLCQLIPRSKYYATKII